MRSRRSAGRQFQKELRMSDKIAVIGAGSWGTAVADLLAGKGLPVFLWARDAGLAQEINHSHHNPRYLTDSSLHESLKATGDLEEALTDAGTVVLVVPSHAMRSIVRQIRNLVSDTALIVSLTKGIEVDSHKRMSDLIREELGEAVDRRLAVLSGPNHSEEVIKKVPSATVVASTDRLVGQKLQTAFMTPYFRVYTNPDIAGVELGGATKNIIALAAGISDGLGYGDNAKAALMTRGLAEMVRLGVNLGADPLTFSGLSGMGDLIATCTSRHSRNRAVGEKLAKGYTLDRIAKETPMVAEGVRTSKAVDELADKLGIEMPITRNVYEVIYKNKRPLEAVTALMSRGATEEIEEMVRLSHKKT